MWKRKDGELEEYHLERAQTPLSRQATLTALRDEREVREGLLEVLRSAPFAAYKWETPAFSDATADAPFGFVLLDSPSLASRQPDPQPFARFLATTAPGDVVDFPNLGGDAHLVVPAASPGATCTHLAAFVRTAPPDHQHALFRRAASLCLEQRSASPRWLSTAGLGVSWLHIRLDRQPKYYGHGPYRDRDR
jgi:hypothetical protein